MISIDPDACDDPVASPVLTTNEPELALRDPASPLCVVVDDVESEIDPLDSYTDEPLDTYTDASRDQDPIGDDDDDHDDRPPEIETDAADDEPALTESPPRSVNVDGDDADDVPDGAARLYCQQRL